MKILISLFIFTAILAIISACHEDVIPVDSETDAKAFIIFEFQGGFNKDQIAILIDGLPRFEQVLSTDKQTDFADRLRIVTSPGAHDIYMTLNEDEYILGSTCHISDSLVLSVINDTLYQKLFIREISAVPDYTILENNDFRHVNITYLYGEGISNLMPPIFGDPVAILITFEIRNIYDKKIISGIYPEKGFLYDAKSGILLEEMTMDIWKDVYIYPGQADTVTFYRNKNEINTIEPPCGDSLFIKINLRDQYYRGIQIKTENFFYRCEA